MGMARAAAVAGAPGCRRRKHAQLAPPNGFGGQQQGAVFRELTHFLQSITELQVPSNLRHFPDVSQENAANGHPSDSLTNGLLARIATADEATRRARLKTIEAGLIKAVL